MDNKKSLKFLAFLAGYCSTAFSALGYVCASMLSPNPFIWWLTIPLIIFIVITDVLMLIGWMDNE